MRKMFTGIACAFAMAMQPMVVMADDAPAAQTETPAEDAQPAPESDPYTLEGALEQAQQALDFAKAAAKASRDSTGLATEGLALLGTINAEAITVAELESKCLNGASDECTKAKRERCPVLGASYHRIEERFAAFDKKVAEATFPEDIKALVASTSAQIKAGIKDLKEQLEAGKCIDA